MSFFTGILFYFLQNIRTLTVSELNYMLYLCTAREMRLKAHTYSTRAEKLVPTLGVARKKIEIIFFRSNLTVLASFFVHILDIIFFFCVTGHTFLTSGKC